MKSAHDIFIQDQMADTASKMFQSYEIAIEESKILKHWKEDKSILQISNLTNIPRDKVIDIISDYVKMEFSHTQFK